MSRKKQNIRKKVEDLIIDNSPNTLYKFVLINLTTWEKMDNILEIYYWTKLDQVETKISE